MLILHEYHFPNLKGGSCIIAKNMDDAISDYHKVKTVTLDRDLSDNEGF